jgi:hypothetical protein
MTRTNLGTLKFKLQQIQSELRRKRAEVEARQRLAKFKLQQLESELRRLRNR